MNTNLAHANPTTHWARGAIDLAKAGGDVDTPCAMADLAARLAEVAGRQPEVALGDQLAIEEVAALLIMHERRRVAAETSTEQSSVVWIREIGRLCAYARAEGGLTLHDLARLAELWIESPQWSRKKKIVISPTGRMRSNRRSAVRRSFGTLREWGLTDAAPAIDTRTPRPGERPPAGFADHHAALLTHLAKGWTGTVYPVVFGLGAAGVTTGEFCSVTDQHVDLASAKIAAPGAGHVRPRTLSIRPEHIGFFRDRIASVQALSSVHPTSLVYGGEGGPATQTSFACVMLGRLFERASIDAQPLDLRVWAARKAYEAEGNSLEAARAVFGIRSLDRVERLLAGPGGGPL
jgi:hypothetical protein